MVECNRGCGALDLHWKVVNSKYKLFNHNDLLHICNDSVIAEESTMEKATAKILAELNLSEPTQIPVPDIPAVKKERTAWVRNEVNGDASKCFTINTTANGIALTGDDKHNAIYLPKVAIPELVKVLVDFIC